MKTLIALSLLILQLAPEAPREVQPEPRLNSYFRIRLDEKTVVAAQGEEIPTGGAEKVAIEGISHKIFELGEFGMRVLPTVESTVRYGPAIFALPARGMVYVVSVTATEKAAADSLAGIAPSIARNLGGKFGEKEVVTIGGVELERRVVTLRDGTIKHLDGHLGRQGEAYFCVIFEYYGSQEEIARGFIAESLASLVRTAPAATDDPEDG